MRRALTKMLNNATAYRVVKLPLSLISYSIGIPFVFQTGLKFPGSRQPKSRNFFEPEHYVLEEDAAETAAFHRATIWRKHYPEARKIEPGQVKSLKLVSKAKCPEELREQREELRERAEAEGFRRPRVPSPRQKSPAQTTEEQSQPEEARKKKDTSKKT